MNKTRMVLAVLLIMAIVGGAAGFSYYTRQAAEAKERCRQDREDLVKMELVYRNYGPTGQFTTDLHELTHPAAPLWRTTLMWPYLNDYTVEINKFNGAVIIRCSVPGHDDPYAVSSQPGEQPDGTEHQNGIGASAWSIGR